MKKRMTMVLGLALMALVAIGVVWVGCGFENGQPASHTTQDVSATWCQDFTDDPNYQPTRAGWCYRLTGTVVTVGETLNYAGNMRTVLEVDHGDPELFAVYMRNECNRWEPGSAFAEVVALTSEWPKIVCE